MTVGSHERRDCLAASRAVACHFAWDFVARSPFHTATSATPPTARSVDADLGEDLDRELAALPLGQGLHDGDGRLGRGSCATDSTVTEKTRLPVEATDPVAEVPRPSVRTTCSPSRRRRTATAWCASSPVTSTRVPGAAPSRDSTRWTGSDTPAQPWKASRSRPNIDLCGASILPSGCSSPRIAASSRSSSSWRGSRRVGVSTATLTTGRRDRRAGSARRSRGPPARCPTACRGGCRGRTSSPSPRTRRTTRAGRPRAAAA